MTCGFSRAKNGEGSFLKACSSLQEGLMLQANKKPAEPLPAPAGGMIEWWLLTPDLPDRQTQILAFSDFQKNKQ
jgi:hypothetical protein